MLKVPGNETSVNLTLLEKFTNYSIRICAVTVDSGNFSEYIVVSTAEDGRYCLSKQIHCSFGNHRQLEYKANSN